MAKELKNIQEMIAENLEVAGMKPESAEPESAKPESEKKAGVDYV